MHTFKNNVEVNTVYYRDNIEIRNNDVIVNHSDGRVVYTNGGGAGDYQYYLKDHLGNVRLTFTACPDQLPCKNANLSVINENHYYPFGMKMKGDWNSNNTANPEVTNQYNGKEWVDDLGLAMNDYGARWYDPATARWNSVDPLAEKYVGHSPYNYVLGNPIKYIDPDGKSVHIRTNLSSALTDLARIAATQKGRPILDLLINTTFKNVFIEDVFRARNSTYDWQGIHGRKNTLYYPLSVWYPKVRETAYINSYLILGHEINHAYDHFLNRDLYNKDARERSSVYFGNYLRSVYEKTPLRKKYPGLTYGKHKFSRKETVYNKDLEKIADFKEIDSFENGNIVAKGFSYNSASTNISFPTAYILSYTINNEYKYKQFNNFKEYELERNKLIK